MTLDELLLEWSYRSEKGYPSLDSPSDISLLKRILKEAELPDKDIEDLVDDLEDEEGIKTYGNRDGKPGLAGLEDSDEDEKRLDKLKVQKDTEEEEPQQTLKKVSHNKSYTKLTPAKIWDNISGSPTKLANVKGKDQEPRFDILIRKIQNGEELTLIDGSTFNVSNKEESIKSLKKADYNNNKFITFRNEEEGVYMYPFYPSQLAKTKEFGGQPSLGGDIGDKVKTSIKESLVILMSNIYKKRRDLKVFTNESYTSNLEIINSSTIKYQDIEPEVQSLIEEKLELYNSVETPPTKVLKILNNPYSIAVEILKTYPNARFNRGATFDKIREKCKKISGLPHEDKWNPGDIYLVNYDPTLPEDEDSLVPWNELFVNKWGDTDAPLVSISLKEEKYQPGRAKSYLSQFGVKKVYNLLDEEMAYNEEEYKQGIRDLRGPIIDFVKNGGVGGKNEYEMKGDGWKNFSDDIRILRGKFGAYKLLNWLINEHNKASILGLFAYGLSIPGKPSANPTFFILQGGNGGELISRIPFPGGSNTDMADNEPVIIEDNAKAANLYLRGFLKIVKEGEVIHEKYKVMKAFRGDDKGQIGIT